MEELEQKLGSVDGTVSNAEKEAQEAKRKHLRCFNHILGELTEMKKTSDARKIELERMKDELKKREKQH